MRVGALPLVMAAIHVAVLGSGFARTSSQLDESDRRRSVWEGVYSTEEAKSGERQYDEHCAGCHHFDLEGDGLDVPSLAGEEFRGKWDGRSLQDLLSLTLTTMPQNAPATLPESAYADVLSYILQENGFPPGPRGLDRTAASLAAIVIEATTPITPQQRNSKPSNRRP